MGGWVLDPSMSHPFHPNPTCSQKKDPKQSLIAHAFWENQEDTSA